MQNGLLGKRVRGAMQPRTTNEIQRLVDSRTPESPSIEYKAGLTITNSKRDRVEILKERKCM
jgi:hypothetical protein